MGSPRIVKNGAFFGAEADFCHAFGRAISACEMTKSAKHLRMAFG